jgi:uncharacterized protein YbjQ (UPF0145 family)
VVGNSVHSLGFLGTIGSGLKVILGGEIENFTSLIAEGREAAYQRMLNEALELKGSGITGVTSELIFHGSNIEFLSIGSIVHAANEDPKTQFSTSADGQELFAQLDAGYKPICFAFGNVAYSIGIGRGILGGLKTFVRGEIKEYSDIFNHTRHLSLERITQHARQHGGNAVLGIQTTILPFGGVNEMLMIGTASHSEELQTALPNTVVTSDMTNIEMWNMAKMGYAPLQLLLGTSVYSLGFVGGITSALKSLVRGEINELTRMIYDARENAIGIINDQAKALGADDIVGVKTYVYQLGGGLVEFLAIGTAVKKIPGIKTESEQLPPQAIIVDRSTFYDSNYSDLPKNLAVNTNAGSKPINSISIFGRIIIFILVILYFVFVGRH